MVKDKKGKGEDDIQSSLRNSLSGGAL